MVSDFRGMMGMRPGSFYPQGQPNPLLRQQAPQTGQFGWLNRAPMLNKPEEPEYDNQGMFGISPEEFAQNKEALRKNPYGWATGKQGRTPVDDLRMNGAIDDPSNWGWLQRRGESYRSPTNPNGKPSPWNMAKYNNDPVLGFMTSTAVKNMNRAERKAYGQKRFTYDTQLRGGLDDESTYERKRRIENETGNKVTIGGHKAGNYDKYGNKINYLYNTPV